MSISVDVVIPVLNEENALPRCIANLRQFLDTRLEYPCRIVIVDNGSTDNTPAIAEDLTQRYSEVSWIHLDIRGRGRALRTAWLDSEAEVLTYMDVDLSTSLDAFPALVKAIAEERYDVATGSRLMKGSKVTRSLKREITSRSYNMIIKTAFWNKFSDAQCGFKAISRKAADFLVPRIKDQGWFFDTELLLLAEKGGFQVKDIPVEWVDDPDSRVNIAKTARDDLMGLWRLRFGGISRALKATVAPD
jgi:glycosyltransferase involved in cell wall biosynthesis